MGQIEDVVIVETSVWIDYFRDAVTAEVAWLESALANRRLGTMDLSLCEVLQGIPAQAQFELVRDRMTKISVHNSGGEELAVASARNYRFLRSRGVTVRKTIDCIIASYCLERGLYLIHTDRDFDPFEKLLGLRVVHPERLPLQ
jgi:predicted nucleic acid-binding protein